MEKFKEDARKKGFEEGRTEGRAEEYLGIKEKLKGKGLSDEEISNLID